MKRRYIAGGLLLVGVMVALHLIPIGRANGYVKRSGPLTCESVESNRSFRLILGERSEYDAVRKASNILNAVCGYDVVHARLFVL